jgi:hypothetical protein
METELTPARKKKKKHDMTRFSESAVSKTQISLKHPQQDIATFRSKKINKWMVMF